MQTADTLFSGSIVQDTTILDAPAPAAEADTAGISVEDAAGEAVGQVQAMIDGVFAALPKVAVAIVVFLFVWLIAWGVRKVIHRVTPGPVDSSIGIVLGRLAYALLLVVGVFIAIAIVFPTVDAATLLSGLGIGGVAIGFAFQDIFQNLLAGILLLIREPFRVGDEITSGAFTGTVESIETRATFIRTYDGRRIIVPNSKIYSEPVTVITAYDMVRSEYDVGIGYGDDIDDAKRIALETVKAVDGVLADPAPDVLTWDLAGSSVNLRVRWWSDPTRKNVVGLRDQVLRRVSQALLSAGIDLPFPTQQILFHDQTEASDGDRMRQREGWPPPPEGKNPGQDRIVDAIRAAGGAGAADETGEASGRSRPAPTPGDAPSTGPDAGADPPPGADAEPA